MTGAKEAAQEANEILDGVNDKVFPQGPDGDSLLDDALEIGLRSSDQLERTRTHSLPIMHANGQLESQKQSVAGLKDSLNSTGNKDNQINVKLRELQSDNRNCKFFKRISFRNQIEYSNAKNVFTVQDRLNDILNENLETANSIADTRQLIQDYQQGITDVLIPKLQDLKNKDDSSISLASEKRNLLMIIFYHTSLQHNTITDIVFLCLVAEAQSIIKLADAKLTSMATASIKRQMEFDKFNGTMSAKLKMLKDKIAEARNTADGVSNLIYASHLKRSTDSKI